MRSCSAAPGIRSSRCGGCRTPRRRAPARPRSSSTRRGSGRGISTHSGRSSAAEGASSPPACRARRCAGSSRGLRSSRTPCPPRAASARTGSRSRPAVGRCGETKGSWPRGGSVAAASSFSPTPRRSTTSCSAPPTTPRSGSRSPARATGLSRSSRATTATAPAAGSRPCRSRGSCCSSGSVSRRSSTWSRGADGSGRPRRKAGASRRRAASMSTRSPRSWPAARTATPL